MVRKLGNPKEIKSIIEAAYKSGKFKRKTKDRIFNRSNFLMTVIPAKRIS